ncbi:MAG: GFA family protein [bacterium]|nr:GFA family protein [bacterium]
MARIHSSCLCGDVAWSVDGPLAFVHHCHCQRCRKAHGTAFATFGLFPAASLRWERGQDGVVRFASSPVYTRAFCGRCGTIVPSGAAAFEDLAETPLGPLDSGVTARPESHIFVGSKAPWYRIDDGLVQFETYPGGVPDTPAPQPDLVSPAPSGEGTRGSCLCGGVAFVAPGAPLRAASCHCGRCRKARAAAHAANYFTTRDGLRFTQGEELLASYKMPAARYFMQVFCRRCGAKMPRTDAERNIAVIPLGSLDDAPPIVPEMHIFVASKAPWFELPADGLPRHAEGMPA